MLSTVLLGMAVWIPLLVWLPVDFFILPSMKLEVSDRPVMTTGESIVEALKPYGGELPSPYMIDGVTIPLTFHVGPLGYMLIITAENKTVCESDSGICVNADADADARSEGVDGDVKALSEWYTTNELFFQNSLDEYGGVLFRNFNLKSAEDFDRIISNFHPDMLDSQVRIL